MTAKLIQAFAGGIVTREQQEAVNTLDQVLIAAVADAKDAGVPQGFIVALLHGHASQQTNIMIERA